MKEKIKIKTIVCCLMMTSMLLGLGACNNEDDVMEIFNNKTWKLVRIATEKGKEQFYQGLWSNESKEEIDRELNTFRAEGNYTLNFNCAEVNGEEGMMLPAAARPPLQSFIEGPSTVF